MNNSDFFDNQSYNIEEFRNQERGISSIKNISKGNISSRISPQKNVISNYKLSNTPQQFIKPNQQQFIKPNQQQFIKPNQQQFIKPNQQQFIKPNENKKYNTKTHKINSKKKKNRYNFPKLDKLSINYPNYRRYFSYPYYYDYYYDPYLNQTLWKNYPVINATNYYVPYENEDYLIPAERYYKGEIRTDIGGEKDESDIIEAEEFNENDEYNEFDEEENFNLVDTDCNNSIFYLFIVVSIVLLFLLK
jgi:hypothetical protein